MPESERVTREDTNEVVLQIATKIGAYITTQDVSVSHRIGRRGEGNKHRSPSLGGVSVIFVSPKSLSAETEIFVI